MFRVIKEDGIVKSRHSGENRSPGILNRLKTLDSGFRRNDKTRTKGTFYEIIKEETLANLYLLKIHLLIIKLFIAKIISVWLMKTLR